MEREFQNAVGVRIADFACWQRRREWAMALAAGAGHDFPDSTRRVGLAFGILRREPLVIVIVPVDDDGGSRLIQVLPECLHFWIVAMLRAGTE